jgi:hypothetical protein
MRNLLLQLDSSPHPSVFDRVVGLDGGADEVMSYGGVTEEVVRDLVYGAIFTRGPKDLHNTAIFIGGADMAVGERLLAVVRKTFLGPLRVSVMLDSNGSNTTAVAAVAKLQQAAGDVKGLRTVVVGGAGPVGARAAGLLSRAGADVAVTSRWPDKAKQAAEEIRRRFSGPVSEAVLPDSSHATGILGGSQLVLNASKAGIRMIPREAWARRPGLRVAADLNAVPPLGVEGIELNDDGAEREGVTVFGALGIGALKMKIHKACIARLFERNDIVLDAETIADLARELVALPS